MYAAHALCSDQEPHAMRENVWFGPGGFVPAISGATRKLIEPATDQHLATVAECGEADVNAAVTAGLAAIADKRWSGKTPAERGAALLKLAAIIRENMASLATIEARNAGKPMGDAEWEVGAAARVFEYFAGAIALQTGETLTNRADGIGMTFREPIGICGLIVPWNFPLLIATWKLAPCLAAGNVAILKPAPATPLTALLLAELAVQAGIPDGVLSVVTGGDDAGKAISVHPDIRKVSFTGSTSAGKSVMRSGTETLKRVTLELGGKSPSIVFADADIAAAAGSCGSFLGNAGQDCCARSRHLVEASIYDDFKAQFVANVAATKVGVMDDPGAEMGCLISREHRDTVHAFVERAVAAGATILTGGVMPAADAPGAYYPPTVLEGADVSSEIFQEEVFGPVTILVPFTDEAAAIKLANATRFGLSGSVWTRDISKALRVARAVESGVLSINCSNSVHTELPFGGFKESGIGRDLGKSALDAYTEVKTVFVRTI